MNFEKNLARANALVDEALNLQDQGLFGDADRLLDEAELLTEEAKGMGRVLSGSPPPGIGD